MKKKRYCELLICRSFTKCFLLVKEVQSHYSQILLVLDLKFVHSNKTEHFLTIDHLFLIEQQKN